MTSLDSCLRRFAAAAGARVPQTRSLRASWLYAGACTGELWLLGEPLRLVLCDSGLLRGAKVAVITLIAFVFARELLIGVSAIASSDLISDFLPFLIALLLIIVTLFGFSKICNGSLISILSPPI